MTRETAKQIDDAAAGWVVRLDRGLSPAEQEALDAWLGEDERRLGAFARLRALSLHTERSAGLGSSFRPEKFAEEAPASSRRRFIQFAAGGGLGAVAAACGGVWFAFGAGRYSTRKGQTQVIALGDGSVITLNTESAISVRYSRRLRAIDLLAGEALFDVAKDPARPFIVNAGLARVRAVGTRFTVRRLEQAPVQVLVQEGVVEVRAAASKPIVRVSANMRATVAETLPVAAAPVVPAEVGRELSWRQGRLSFEGEPLAQACAEFARYSDTRIVIEDPRLAEEEISGSFQANDPVGFGRAVAEALRARVEVGEGEVRLSSAGAAT